MLTQSQRDFFQERREKQNKCNELRRKIRLTLLSSHGLMSVEQITEKLYAEDKAKIQRELHMLSRAPNSDIYHNGLRGKGSRYGVGVSMILK